MQVVIPPGVAPGQTISVMGLHGSTVPVVVPPGATPGQTIAFEAPDEEFELESCQPLTEKRYDVTDLNASIAQLIACPCLGWTSTQMVLGDQEVLLQTRNLCSSSRQRRPYAQLGSVDKAQSFGMFYSIHTDMTPVNEKGQGGLRPGCFGCDEAYISEIVNELQERKLKRGGVAQMKKLEYMVDKSAKIATQVTVMNHQLGAAYKKKPEPKVGHERLPPQVFDVSNFMEMLNCTTKELRLDVDEAHLKINRCCGLQTYVTHREYAAMGFVEKKKSCICCFTLSTDMGPSTMEGGMGSGELQPGCPCTNGGRVTMLVQALRERMAARGQVGQIRKQEKMLKLILEIEEGLNSYCDHAGIPFPPTQEKMRQYNVPTEVQMLSKVTDMGDVSQGVQSKTYDVTNTIDACMTCVCSCGVAGCTRTTMELGEDDLYITTKNNIDDSNLKMSYTEMDSVDVEKSCCCCWAVNDQSPGLGCSRALVEEIAEELQTRKEKRGNIAHLRQLKRMQTTSLALNLRGTLMAEEKGIQYPPSQEVMSKLFRGRVPEALRSSVPPHVEPDKEFETRTYSVTNYIEACATCVCTPWSGPVTRRLELDAEEMKLTRTDFCSSKTSRTPYGNLGAVEEETMNCCCVMLPDVANPGCGCDRAKVSEIAAELQERKVMRGNIAQMKQQENIINEVLHLGVKVDLLYEEQGLQFPPPPEVMAQAFLPDSAAIVETSASTPLLVEGE
jgi:hypothetical protein